MDNASSALFYFKIVIAIAATVCAAALIRKAVSFHAKLWLGTIVFVLCTIVFSYMAVHVPLYFMSGSSRVEHHLTADVMMFGAAGLIVIALIGFTIDHMNERPSWLMVAAAACLAIGIFPFLFQLVSKDTLKQKYDITIEDPETPKNKPGPNLDSTPSAPAVEEPVENSTEEATSQ